MSGSGGRGGGGSSCRPRASSSRAKSCGVGRRRRRSVSGRRRLESETGESAQTECTDRQCTDRVHRQTVHRQSAQTDSERRLRTWFRSTSFRMAVCLSRRAFRPAGPAVSDRRQAGRHGKTGRARAAGGRRRRPIAHLQLRELSLVPGTHARTLSGPKPACPR